LPGVQVKIVSRFLAIEIASTKSTTPTKGEGIDRLRGLMVSTYDRVTNPITGMSINLSFKTLSNSLELVVGNATF
jgi:hypothetical protein